MKKLISTSSYISDSIYNPNEKLLSLVEESTLINFTNYFKRFILFLLRIKYLNENKKNIIKNDFSNYQISIINDSFDSLLNFKLI